MTSTVRNHEVVAVTGASAGLGRAIVQAADVKRVPCVFSNRRYVSERILRPSSQ